jgi:hypothetical protein
MSAKKRLDTIRVIASKNKALYTSARQAAILGEFNRIAVTERSGKHDGWLLTVLHTTKALDTSLSEVIKSKGWSAQSDLYSLGVYLKAFAQHSILTEKQRIDFQKPLVDKRNKYMHEAGATPDKLEADSILNEMHAYLILVLLNT